VLDTGLGFSSATLCSEFRESTSRPYFLRALRVNPASSLSREEREGKKSAKGLRYLIAMKLEKAQPRVEHGATGALTYSNTILSAFLHLCDYDKITSMMIFEPVDASPPRPPMLSPKTVFAHSLNFVRPKKICRFSVNFLRFLPFFSWRFCTHFKPTRTQTTCRKMRLWCAPNLVNVWTRLCLGTPAVMINTL
jgi:hypothetical protein